MDNALEFIRRYSTVPNVLGLIPTCLNKLGFGSHSVVLKHDSKNGKSQITASRLIESSTQQEI